MGAKRLSDEQVRRLRTRCVVNGESIAALAREFGVSVNHARRIVVGDYRVAAGGPLHEPGEPGTTLRAHSAPVTELSPEDRALARRLAADGAQPENVALAMMCTPEQIERALRE